MGFDIAGNEGGAFPFDNIGDTVTGQILSLEEVQQTDMETGELSFWNDNPAQPKMMYRVTLQTTLKDDPTDDGKRAVYLRGSKKAESKSTLSAVLGAVRAATGSTELDEGGTLTLAYVGEEPPAKRGYSARKLYEAQYQAPSRSVDLGGGQPQAQAQAAPPQQVQQQIPQQPAVQPVAQQGTDPWQVQQSVQQPVQQQVPAQQVQQQVPAQQAPTPGNLTPEQIAALKAAGVDPAQVQQG